MTNIIKNVLTDEELSLLAKEKTVKSFFVPTCDNIDNSFDGKHYTFHMAQNGLYLATEGNNHRVLELKLGKPNATNTENARTLFIKFLNKEDRVIEAQCVECKTKQAENFVLDVAKKKPKVNIDVDGLGNIVSKVNLEKSVNVKKTKAPKPPFKKNYLPKNIQKQVDEYKEAHKPPEKKEDKKFKIWEDGIKPWVELGVRLGGIFSAVWLIMSAFAGPLLFPLLLASLTCTLFSSEVVGFGEKFVAFTKKQFKNVKTIRKYVVDSFKFSHEQKQDEWKNRKSLKQKIIEKQNLSTFKRNQDIEKMRQKMFQRQLRREVHSPMSSQNILNQPSRCSNSEISLER